MRKTFVLMMMTGILIGACGRKEMPQVDTEKPLRLVNLQHQKAVNVLQLQFTILGGTGPVGYHIDRAEIDPHCNCPAFWQRYFEQPAVPRQKGKILTKNMRLLTHKREFAFRIRAVDSMGNLGAWSTPIRARADDVTL